jgi:two-component system cell cycle sensor histidine kinase/response regulator CckA
VNVMKLGAADYLLKDRMARLGPAITQAMEKWQMLRGRKQARMALRESEERFRQLAESIQDVFWLTDLGKNQILYVSPGYQTIWGRSCNELYLYPGTWIEAVHPEDRERILQAATTKQMNGDYDEEYRIVRPDGSVRWIRDRAYPVANTAGEIDRVAGVARDITEQKELEARCLRAQRMESIGTLASGVAHDLNNILAPIMMSIPLLRNEMSAERRERIIAAIEKSVERGAEIVKQVLTFSRGARTEKGPLQVGDLIKEVTSFLRETFPRQIAIETSLTPDLWPVIGDATQLHQVLLNLCVNARDAMPDGGRLSLKATNLDLDANLAIMLPEATPGRHVLLEVSDTGAGMAPGLVQRIFEPFFTTKSGTQGTGLGLSMVNGITKSHGGFLKVVTHPGKGSTFQVYLPAAPEQDGMTAVTAAHEDIPPGHGELILVVDDEANVRNAARVALEAFGYQVLLAADGIHALAILAQNIRQIRLVVTDLSMPLMDGKVLISAIRRIARTIPILASTARGDQSQSEELKALGVEMVLSKPYSSCVLLRSIHDALQSTTCASPQVGSKPAQPGMGADTNE